MAKEWVKDAQFEARLANNLRKPPLSKRIRSLPRS